MFIIYSGKTKETHSGFYKVHCSCGCVFDCTISEFTIPRTPNEPKYIRCPECTHIVKDELDQIEEISKDDYVTDFIKYGENFKS